MNAFIKKLLHFAPLSSEEQAVLSLACRSVRTFPAGATLLRAGEKPRDLFIILEGFACRIKADPDGKSSIVSYLVPGDTGDQHGFILKETDHDVTALSQCIFAFLPQDSFSLMVERFPRVIHALWWATLVEQATSREWVFNVAARQAPKRVAHLLCELLMRLELVGLVHDDSYILPITQAELGDTLGLSSIHICRVLRFLRDRGLIDWNKSKTLTIPDVAKLKAFGAFDPNYHHLEDRY